MSRKAIVIIVSLILPFSPALAGSPLPPGKPAGVKQAQHAASGAIAVGALALIAIAGYVVSTHPYNLPGATASTSTQP
jgi:hypothetical protein